MDAVEAERWGQKDSDVPAPIFLPYLDRCRFRDMGVSLPNQSLEPTPVGAFGFILASWPGVAQHCQDGIACVKAQNVILSLLCYQLMLLCSLMFASLVWLGFANGHLYQCTDPLLDLWPPFIHPSEGDTYLVSKPLVMIIWGGFVGAAFALPALVVWAVWRFTREDASETSLAV